MNLWNGRIYLRFWLENKANCEFDFWFIENCKFTMKIKSKPILNRYSMLSPNSKINIEKICFITRIPFLILCMTYIS